MAATVTHKFVSLVADGTDATQVRPSNWNDSHDVTISAADIGAEPAGNLATHAGLTTTAHGGIVAAGDSRLSDARTASDVSAWAKSGTKPSYTASEVGADATGTAAAAISGHLSAFTHSDIAHSNRTALDKITENDGSPQWNGSNWPGGSGTLGYTQELVTSPTIVAGVLTLNLGASGIFTINLSATITSIVITDTSTAGLLGSFFLIFTADGTARAVTWPNSVKWDLGVAPVLTATLNKKDAFTFITLDGGTTWYAMVSMRAA